MTKRGYQPLRNDADGRKRQHHAVRKAPPGLPTLLGNTVSEKGTILMIDWERGLASGTLDGAVQATVADDLAVNGSRPEYVRVGQRWLVATADYGAQANEVRLYDPEMLKTAARTSEPGVLVHRFRSSSYVQPADVLRPTAYSLTSR